MKSVSCPFSASATEGSIGILKGLVACDSGRRQECTLGALLTARRYDVGDVIIEDIAPWNEHAEATVAIVRVLMTRDGLKKRARQRGEAVLASQQQERVQKAARVAKRQRLEEGSSQKLDDPADVEALAAIHGSTRALSHQ